jgi:hypothetical protein
LKEVTAILFIIAVVVVYIGVLLVVPMALEEAAKRRRRKSVGELVANAFSKTPLTRKQIEILSTDNRLTSRDTQILLRNQFSEAVKSADEKRDERIKYFQELYEELEKDEPFEGLPSDVRLHLEKIRESIGKEKDFLMQPLASQLQDLSSSARRKEKWMWVLTIASFAVGVVGVVFGALPYLPNHSQEKQILETSKNLPNNPNPPTTQGLAHQSSGSDETAADLKR